MPYHKPGQSHNKRYGKKRAKFADIAFRPGETSTPSQAVAPTVNVQVNQTYNQTYNILQSRVHTNEEFPSLKTLNAVLSLDAESSYLCSTDSHPTIQHREADVVEKKAAEIAETLREEGEKKLRELGLPNPIRTINDLYMTVAVVAIRKEAEQVTPTYWLSLDNNPSLRANVCDAVRWVCTQSIKQSGSVELLAWVNGMPWQQLKTHLMLHLPGYGWSCWVEPGEKVYNDWYDECVRRGLEKDIQLMVGIEESKAVEVTGGGSKMRAIQSSKRPGTMSKLLTQRRNDDEDMNSRMMENDELWSRIEEDVE